jgi:hypothetical protein
MEKPIKVNWWLPVLNVIIILGLFVWGNSCLYAREQKSQLDQANMQRLEALQNSYDDIAFAYSWLNREFNDYISSIELVKLRLDAIEDTVWRMLGCNKNSHTFPYTKDIENPYRVWDIIEVKPWFYKVFYKSMFSLWHELQYVETFETKKVALWTHKCFSIWFVEWQPTE